MPIYREPDMTFEEFLALIRKELGSYCTDSYWMWKFSMIIDKRKSNIMRELAFLAVNAAATDYDDKTPLP